MVSNKKASSKLTFSEMYSQSLGNVIGAGIITSTGIVIGFTGQGVWLAYLLSGLAFLLTVGPVLVAASVVPKTSGTYYYSSCIGLKWGGFYSYLFLFASISIGFMGVSFAEYMHSITSFGNKQLWGIGVLTFFFILNLFDQKVIVKFQTVLNIFLVGAWVSFVVLGLPKVDWSSFTIEGMFPSGWFGMWDSVATLVFAMGGAIWLADSGERIKDPEKNIIKANLAIVATAGILFAIISVVAAGVLPIPDVVNQPLTKVARAIYPGQTYFLFVIGGALLALATTINGRFLGAANNLLRSGKEGWFPSAMGKQNKNDVPYVFLIIVYLTCILPILFSVDTALLNRMSAASMNITRIIPTIGLLFLIKKHQEEWKNSKYYMSKPVLTVFMVVCTGVLIAATAFNMRTFTPGLWMGTAALILGFFIIASIREKHVKRIIEENEIIAEKDYRKAEGEI